MNEQGLTNQRSLLWPAEKVAYNFSLNRNTVEMSESWLESKIVGHLGKEDYNAIQRFARSEFTPLVEILMMFPPLNRYYVIIIFVPIFIALYLVYTVIFTISCVYMRHDFVVWSEIIHHTLIVYLGIFINTVIFVRRRDLLGLTSTYMNGVYTYSNSTQDSTLEKLKKDNSLLQRKLFMVPVVILGVTGTAIGLKPFIDKMMDVHPDKVLVENNIAFSSLVPIYYPFKLDDIYVKLSANSVFTVFVGMVVLTIVAADILFVRVSSLVSLELNILIESLKAVEERAKHMYEKMYGMAAPSKKKGIDFPFYQGCIARCIKENVEHHHNIIKFYQLFSSVASPAIGGGFFICSIVMGLGMIIVNMKNVNPSALLAFAGIVIAEVMNAFMIAWMSERIGEQNVYLYNTVYGMNWYRMDRKIKKLVITFLDGTREPLFLNAFGMAKINMETFGSLVNGSYSLLNLVKASEAREESKKG